MLELKNNDDIVYYLLWDRTELNVLVAVHEIKI